MSVKRQESIKYGILSNILFMLKNAHLYCKSVYLLIIFEAFFYAADNVLSIFLLPSILTLIQNGSGVQPLFKTIVLFSSGIVLCKGFLGYIETNSLFGRVEIRSRLVFLLGKKAMTTSYNNLYKEDFINHKNKAMQTTDSNSEACEAIWDTLSSLLKYISGFLIYIILLSSINFKIIAAVLCTSVISFILTNAVNTWKYKNKSEEEKHITKLHYITECSKSKEFAKDIRMFGMQNWFKELYLKHLKLYMYFQLKGEIRYFFADLSDIILTALRNGLAYYWLISSVIKNALSIPQFILYFTAVTVFTQWIMEILNTVSTLHKQSLEISCFREFLEYKEDFLFAKGEELPVLKENTIELQNITFRYSENGTCILDNFNLKIKPKEKLAIVGLNGAGKTTLVKLITGLYDPNEGRVLFNGKDIKTFTRSEYYKCFSAVFQEFSILPAPIFVNVAQAEESADKNKVKECLKLADLFKKVCSLPDKEDTLLCKDIFFDATELSGGEIQKLLLARALYQDRPFLILDEPTAALDPIAENELYKKYNELSKDKTSVFISHRLASTRFCDRIIFLHNGKIIEEGTHDELLNLNGEYAKLFNVQSKYYRENPEKEEQSERSGNQLYV